MKQHHTEQFTCKKRAQKDVSVDYDTCVDTVQKFIYKTYTRQYVQSKANMKEISNIYICMLIR